MTVRKTLTALVLGFAILGTGLAASADVPKSKADHTALSVKYEKMAADQEALVKEHTEMKQDYKSKWQPKTERDKALAEMDTHCDAIISSAKKLADEYKAMAQWHKFRAEEMGK